MALIPGLGTRSDSPLGTRAQFPANACGPWSAPTKVAFRFAFLYFGLYNLETPLYLLAFPPFIQLSSLYESIRWHSVLWVSKHILHLSHDFGTDFHNLGNGSKDTTYAYVQVLGFVVIAALGTLIWSLLDRERREYVWLHRWFQAYLRLSLACALIPYGAIKIFPVQFPPANLSQLLQPLGTLRPREMLWLSMGTSPSYTFFCGATEILSGLLLMIPRLAIAGALLSTASMVNVLMLNLGYDVAAKLTVIHLVMIGLVILLPDATRLLDFFLLNRSVPGVNDAPLFRRRSLARAAVVLQIAFGVILTGYDVYRSYQVAAEETAARETPLYGIWRVEDYVVNGRPITPLSTDPHRWQRLIVISRDFATVQVMTGEVNSLVLTPDNAGNRLVLTQSGNPNWTADLAYDNSRPGSLVLQGKMGGQPVVLRMHREDESKFLLNSQPFHWINDGGEY